MTRGSTGPAAGNLPAELTSFVGREPELDVLAQRLAGSRLVTVVGPGGVGKTRLAIRAANKVRRAFPDGTWLVDLGTLRDPTLLAEHVAASLGLRDTSGQWLVATLSDHLARRRLLLVLDNCEHLLDACAAFVRALLQAGPELRIVATSREPLRLTAESLIHIGPLEIDGPAIDLLRDRASAVRAEFVLSREARPTALEICRRLDGIPLAIELAAARLRGMALDEVLAHLGDRLALLTSGDRSGPARQHTLRATLDWSHELLEPDERILWRRLSTFSGTFDIAAARAICADDEDLPVSRVLDVLTRLAEASIVQLDDALVGRYRMLETIREYAAERAAAASESESLADRHCGYFLALTRQAIYSWATGDQVRWFRRLSTEYDNLRQALERSRETPDRASVGADIAARLWLWWQVAGRIGEGRRWITALLEAAPEGADAHRVGLFATGFLALAQRDVEAAESDLRAALELARHAADEEVEAYAVGYLGLVRLFEGSHDDARAMFLDAVERHRRGGRTGMAAFHLADAAIAATLLGNAEAAVSEFTESLQIAGERGDTWTQSHALWGLGLARLAGGDAIAAETVMRQALVLIRDVGDATGVALALEGLAAATAARGDAERAAWLAGLADGYWDAIPASPPRPVLALRESSLASARQAMGERRFEAAVSAARASAPADAVADALGEVQEAPPAGEVSRPTLSRREREVAALIADGLSNREVAQRLVLSPRTVESHVERIMNRLGVNSRTQIATWMARNASNSEAREIP